MVTFLTFFFFFNDTATTEIYTLSLHDALPISLINNHHRSLVTDPPPIAIPISIPITFAYNSTPMAPPSDDSDMRLASELHRQGRLADAERVYRRILARQPDHVDATHMMGVLAGAGSAISDGGRVIPPDDPAQTRFGGRALSPGKRFAGVGTV